MGQGEFAPVWWEKRQESNFYLIWTGGDWAGEGKETDHSERFP